MSRMLSLLLMLFLFASLAMPRVHAAEKPPIRIAVVPAIPAAAGGVLLPDRLSAGVADLFARSLGQIRGVIVSNSSAVYHAALAAGGAGGTTPLAAGLAARRVQADLAVLVEAKANGTELKITGTPVLPESGRGKVPSPFTQQGTRTLETDLFSIQAGFIKAGLEALALKPTPQEQARIDLVARSTVSPEAFQLYCEARQHLPIASVEAYDRAIKALRRVVVGDGPSRPPVDPEFALAHAALAEAAALGSMQQWLVGLRDQRLMALALSSAETAVKLRPELPDSHRALALAGALVKRISVAVNAARKALEILPDDPQSHLWLGVANGGDGAREIETALALDPSLGLGHLFLAVLAAAEGDQKRMLAQCERALELSPVDASPLLLIGMMQTGEGKIDEAIATYQRVLKINRHAGLAHGALARLYYRKGQTGLAQDALRQAFALDYRVAELMREQAAAYQQAGKLEEAEKEYRLILLGDDKDTPSLRGLGMLALKRGKVDEAEKLLRRALQISPKDAWSFVGLSRCHYRQGKRDEALQDLRRAAEVQPDDGFVQLELGQAYEQHNRTREALEAYDKAIRLLRLPDAYFRKAQLLAKSDPARARDAWKGFLEAIEAMGGPASESDRVRVEMAKRALQ